jgi:hypothetical protein
MYNKEQIRKGLLKPTAVISAPRTGSTFIWQCLEWFFSCNCYQCDNIEAAEVMFNHLTGGVGAVVHGHKNSFFDLNEGKYSIGFQHKGEKTHNSVELWWNVVITERNVIDSYLSDHRVNFNNNDEFLKSINKEDILFSRIDHYKDQLQYIEHLKETYKGRILTLQYEKFVNDYNYIFDKFESFFIFNSFPYKLTLPDNIKDIIMEQTTREKNIKAQEKLKKSFGGNKRGLHKRHVWSTKVNYSKDILTEKNYNRLLEEFAPNKIIPSRNVEEGYLRNAKARGGKKNCYQKPFTVSQEDISTIL